VIAYVRLIDGEIVPRRRLRLFATGKSLEPLEVGCFRPSFSPTDGLTAGEVGYVATGLKTVRDCHVGDTLTTEEGPAASPLPGYQPAKPMVFAGLYPAHEDFEVLRDALESSSSTTRRAPAESSLRWGRRAGSGRRMTSCRSG
jgi:GTP-binding protein LepA